VPTVKFPVCDDAKLTFGPEAAPVMVVVSVELSFDVFVSPPPATVAMLATLAGALAETFTVSVIGL
jgi:hypothetical protein